MLSLTRFSPPFPFPVFVLLHFLGVLDSGRLTLMPSMMCRCYPLEPYCSGRFFVMLDALHRVVSYVFVSDKYCLTVLLKLFIQYFDIITMFYY